MLDSMLRNWVETKLRNVPSYPANEMTKGSVLVGRMIKYWHHNNMVDPTGCS